MDLNGKDQANEAVPAKKGSRESVATGCCDLGYPKSRMILFAGLAILGVSLDLWTKSLAFDRLGLPTQSPPYYLWDGVFGFETAVNIGAVFGLGAGKGTFFAAFSIVAGFGIVIWLFRFGAAASLWLTGALGMITGGILGNLYDRLGMWWQPGYPDQWKSGVRDFILFRIEGVPMFDPWPNFNIADALLVVGAGMLIFQSFLFAPEEVNQKNGADTNKEPTL